MVEQFVGELPFVDQEIPDRLDALQVARALFPQRQTRHARAERLSLLDADGGRGQEAEPDVTPGLFIRADQ